MIDKNRDVVVGVDGSDSAQGAFAHGAWEARRRSATLRLVYVSHVPPRYVTGVDLSDADRTAGATMLAEYAQRAQAAYPELRVESEVRSGSPGAALVTASRDAALVVVGSRGLGGFAGLLLGSVGMQLAAHSVAPVIVMRPPNDRGNLGSAPTSAPVVVGVDGIPESTAALGFAFEEASARGVGLIATYAWWMLPPSSLGPETPSKYDLAEAEEAARRMLAEAVAGWRSRYPDVDVTLRPERSLNPVVGLLEQSRTAGLLVVSRHGGNTLSRLLFASISDTAVREAHCPVAVVPDQAA
ncbi:MAG: universal stress protein [Micromonosporaceae bacterium]|nr:universal stress protein [Micromonosporaceae bacterium]